GAGLRIIDVQIIVVTVVSIAGGGDVELAVDDSGCAASAQVRHSGETGPGVCGRIVHEERARREIAVPAADDIDLAVNDSGAVPLIESYGHVGEIRPAIRGGIECLQG